LAPPEESRTAPVSALRPLPEPSTIVLVIDDPIAPADVQGLCERVRVLLEGCEAGVIVCDVGGLVDPDAGTVDALARLRLTTRRMGRRLRVRNACGELRDLLLLMGLGEVLPCGAASAFEPRGQPEEREQGRRVEEEADPADPTT
jgi:STAS domain-containing protein